MLSKGLLWHCYLSKPTERLLLVQEEGILLVPEHVVLLAQEREMRLLTNSLQHNELLGVYVLG